MDEESGIRHSLRHFVSKVMGLGIEGDLLTIDTEEEKKGIRRRQK